MVNHADVRDFLNGIIRIGRFDTDIDHIRRQQDGFSITIERAG